MKKLFLTFVMIFCSVSVFAQLVTEADSAAYTSSSSQSGGVGQSKVRYGYCSRSQLLQAMPEYGKALQELTKLREQFEQEAYHNETDFRRQFTEYLNGQKDFPQAILLKRQRDLQNAMESGIAFRLKGDSILRQAEHDIMAPLYQRVDDAIRAVGNERGLDYVVDTDKEVFVFLRPECSEDITNYVLEKFRN